MLLCDYNTVLIQKTVFVCTQFETFILYFHFELAANLKP